MPHLKRKERFEDRLLGSLLLIVEYWSGRINPWQIAVIKLNKMEKKCWRALQNRRKNWRIWPRKKKTNKTKAVWQKEQKESAENCEFLSSLAKGTMHPWPWLWESGSFPGAHPPGLNVGMKLDILRRNPGNTAPLKQSDPRLEPQLPKSVVDSYLSEALGKASKEAWQKSRQRPEIKLLLKNKSVNFMLFLISQPCTAWEAEIVKGQNLEPKAWQRS